MVYHKVDEFARFFAHVFIHFAGDFHEFVVVAYRRGVAVSKYAIFVVYADFIEI